MSVKTDQVVLDLIINGEKGDASLKQLQSTARTLKAEMAGLSPTSDEFKMKMEQLGKVNEKLKPLQAEIRNVGAAMKESAEHTSVFGDMLKAISFERVIDGVKDFVKESVQAYLEEELNLKRLDFAVRNLAGGTTETVAELKELAEQLEGMFTHKEIESAEQMAAQYHLNAEEIKKLLPLVVDFAAENGRGLAASMEAVLKGLNGNVKGLKDMGINFTDAGDKGSNFNKMMEQLSAFSGAAAESMDGATGEAKRLKNEWESFTESVGEFSVWAANGLIDLFKRSVNPALYSAEEAMRMATKAAADARREMHDTFEKMNEETLAKRIEFVKKNLELINSGNVQATDAEKKYQEHYIAVAENVLQQKKHLALEQTDIHKLTIEQLTELDTKASQAEIQRRQTEGRKYEEHEDKIKAAHKQLLDEIDKLNERALENGMTDVQKEVAQVQFKYQKLLERAAGNAADVKQLEVLQKEELEAIRLKYEKKELDEKEKLNQDIYKLTLTSDQQEIAAEVKKFDDLIAKAKLYKLDTVALEKAKFDTLADMIAKQGDKEAKLEDDKNKKILAADKKRLDEERKLANARIEIATSIAEGYKSILSVMAGQSADNAEFQKDIALFQIAIDTAKAIAGAVAAGSDIPYPGNLVAIASSVATVLAEVASAKSVLDGAGSAPAAFAAGGSTMPSFASGGNVNKPFVAMAGEAGPEWIAPNWMMNNPATANIIGMLEQIRVQKFAAGGTTSSGGAPSFSNSSSTGDPQVREIMMQLAGTLQALNARLDQPIYGVWDFDYYTRTKARIEGITKAATIG